MTNRIIGVLSLAVALCSGPALAAQNVANTSQKGSLLIFPLISVDPENSTDTFIEISNDNISPVHLECSYVNEAKGRVGFDFTLTAKATASWEALRGDGMGVAPFPTNVSWTGSPGYAPPNPYRGELICFAVDAGLQYQIAFNHLTGTATVAATADPEALQSKQGFRYNSWNFAARSASGLAADNAIQGPPGRLWLEGNGAGSYDACPAYNVANFIPNGATLDSLTTTDNDLSVVSCKQDLRQDYQVNLTMLQFSIWNANENSYSGSYQCADSVSTVGLSSQDNGYLVAASNFDYATLRTANGRFQVSGVASTQCPGSKDASLLGVLSSSIGINDTGEDQEVGSTTQGAGAMSGFVFWDPSGAPPPMIKH
jgi:hypothetical protein